MIKKLLIGILTVVSFSSFADYSNENKNIPYNIQRTLDDVDTFLRAREEQVQLNYPDYRHAFLYFMNEVENTTNTNRQVLIQINKEIEKFTSELAELERQYRNTPSDALKKLIKRKKTIELAKLETKVNGDYEKFLKDTMSLNQKLRLATKVKFKGFGSEQVLLTLFPLTAPFTITGIIPGLYAYKVVDNFNDVLSVHDADDDRSIFDTNRKLSEAKKARQDYIKSKSQSLFRNCRTQGCVYYLAEDYISFINIVSKLNRSVKNNIGIRFKKIRHLKRSTIKAIDDVSSFAARTLPTGSEN